MPISMFETREMIPMLEEAKPANTFLKNTFFSNVVTHETKYVDIDIWQGKRRLAPFVNPNIGSKTVERTGYKTETYEPPQVAPDMVTTAEDLLKRSPGETIYGAKSPDERAAEQLTKDMMEMDSMITRREEQMCSQALFTGQVQVVGEGVNDTIQYWSQLPAQNQPKEALGAGSRWNESGAEILNNLRAWRRKVVQASGIAPTNALLGADAAEALLGNDTLLKILDTRRMDEGMLSPEFQADGVVYYGRLKGTGLDLWGYDEWYLDANGDEQPMVPTKSVLLGSPNVRTSMLYGCVVDPVEGSFAAPRVPVSWTQRKDPAGRILAVKSKPLPVIHQVNGFYVADVLA